MKKREKELFFLLCDHKCPDIKKIKALLRDNNASPTLLGTLFENRMAAVAYGVLTRTELIDMTDREFRNSLKNAHLINIKIDKDYIYCVDKVNKILSNCGAPYALLKGAFLCGWYPSGYRTSNDIDVLVSPNNVGLVSSFLKDSGFKQGYIRNGNFIPATREQIIESKMTRGETVPFIKKVNLPFMEYLEVDINFSLDYKNSDSSLLDKMLSRAETVSVGEITVRTLDKYDFLLHLCAHLYKEATTLPWIKMKRDMTFYKYCDIYSLLHTFNSEEKKTLVVRAKEIDSELELKYCLYSIMSFYKANDPVFKKYLEDVDLDIHDYVVDPAEKKLYKYKVSDPRVRFFSSDREKLLEEI